MKTETNINQLASNLATKLVEHQLGWNLTWVISEDGSECFTAEAQDLFNQLYDVIYNELEW